MKTNEINLRDPFILLHNGKYYMYGSRVEPQLGFDVYVGEDLENWSEPKSVFELTADFWGTTDCWAPEVHLYNGRFYMFASFNAPDACRGTAILVSDTPDGTFRVHCPRATPADWLCLDGTLYVENGTPYMIFCHEWCQVKNGEVCAVELTQDLGAAKGEPRLLWKAGDASWVSFFDGENYVTDGPFLFRDDNGTLKSLWSSFSNGEYVLATATATEGKVWGEWKVDEELLYKKDGGHGMIFNTKEGTRMISLHVPNQHLAERPRFIKMPKI